MKHRLQFRHNNTIWKSRAEAKTCLENIVNSGRVESIAFEESLYAEPLVTRYLDEDGNLQVIFAIGVNSGYTKYHTIDSKEIAELIDNNKKAIEAEVERAKDAEKSLSGSIETEIARAMEAELFLSGAVDTERDERIAADAVLQTQITENIAKIVPVTENLGANVREEYVLKNAKGEELGSHIKVYKDSALVGAEVNYKGAISVSQKEDGTFEFLYSDDADKEYEYLYLIYRNENGGLSLVALDFENFLMESEVGLGINLVDRKITIKIKDGEKYLTTTENGLQTISIDEAIKDAVDTLSEIITAKIDAEIERSIAADDYISGLTAEFSAATVSEFILVNSALTIETERALASELFLSGAVDTERSERIQKDKELDAEIASIKNVNTALDKKIDIEITRSINEDENFRIQLEHLTSDLNTEISNRELANASIRGEFNTADIALGSRIDTEAEIRMSADNTLSDRIDNEANIRTAEDTLLTNTINGVSERLSAVESDYLKYQDKADVLLAVSGAQNVAIEAVNAAASAQTTADEAKAKIEGFMAAAEIGGAAIDTLIEIQNYIKTDGAAAADMLDSIAENKRAIETEVERAKSAEKTLEDTIKSEESARIEAVNILSGTLANEITRATGAETNNATAISNEVKRASDAESTLQTALTTEINNRESADNSIRDAFALADSALGERINAEESARQTSYDALNTRIDNESTTRASAVAALTTEITNGDNAVREALQAETTNRETADANLANLINQEVSARTQDVLSIGTKLTTLEGVDAALDTKVNTLSASVLTEINAVKNAVVSEITSAFTSDDAKVLEASKIYADDAVKVAVDGINAKKVNDVSYDNGNKKIYLSFADGTVSNGFDASEFVVDGMLSAVTFDNANNTIKFIWNTASEIEEMIVPLDKFVDQYTVSENSTSFLKISDDNKISALVDNADGFVNTLASTNYVQSIVEGAQQTLSANTYNSLTELKDYVNTLSGNVKTTITNDVNALSGSILTYINTADNTILSAITKNEAAIAVLNADKKTEGSVLYRIENEFEKSLITDGVPVTAVSPEEANKVHSLIRQITVNGEMRYYVVSDATEMFYVKPRTTETAPIETVNLNDYITGLEARIAVLEENLTGFAGNIEQTIKDIIKSYLVGTENEIKITETDDKLTIGFDDNAIFGEI